MTESRYRFVHINKCAGTSIKKALGYRPLIKHQKVSDMPHKHLFTFAFVRDPLDRIVSMYNYRKYNLKRVKLENETFEGWFWKAFTQEGYTAVPLMNLPCWDWISVDDKLAVDYVGKYEYLERDFREVCDIIGVKVWIGHVNKTVNIEPCTYTEEMKQFVEKRFAKDFELWM